jgi:prepilin peptidase CpaA
MIGGPYFLLAAIVIAGLGAWFDWRTGRKAESGYGVTGDIPNWLTWGALLAAPVAHAVVDGARLGTFQAAVNGAGFSVLGAALCALVPAMLYRVSAIGAGDVKLFAALGGILQPLVGIEMQFYACLATAILACGKLAYDGALFRVLGNAVWMFLFNPLLPKARRREITPEAMTWTRFGPGIFVGTVVAVLQHWRQM